MRSPTVIKFQQPVLTTADGQTLTQSSTWSTFYTPEATPRSAFQASPRARSEGVSSAKDFSVPRAASRPDFGATFPAEAMREPVTWASCG